MNSTPNSSTRLKSLVLVLLAASLELTPNPLFGATVPFHETFDAASLTNLSPAWSFESTGGGMVSIADEPVPGSPFLRLSQSGFASEGATLTLDLTGQTNVTLDFRLMQAGTYSYLGTAAVRVSQDSTNWFTIAWLDWMRFQHVWRHISIDLDSAIAAHELNYGADFQIQFHYETPYYGRGCIWLWDDIRVTTGEDVFGPSVTGLSPAAAVEPPLESCRLTFSEAISPANFPVSAVTVLDPAGQPVDVNAVVADADMRSYQVNFVTPQNLPGIYRIALDATVADAAGNWLDQDQDGTSNPFFGTLQIASRSSEFPVCEKFDGGLTNPPAGWRFETADTRTVSIVDDPSAPGNPVLAFPAAGYGSQSAILTLDLTGRTNVVLDFRVQQAARYNALGAAQVFISQDGTNWHPLAIFGWLPYEVWRQVSLELDSVVRANGLAYGAGFQIKFYYEAGRYSRGNVWLWDDILVSSLGHEQRTLNIHAGLGSAELSFNPDPAFDYTVQYRDAMNGAAPWLDFPGAPHNSGLLIDSAPQAVRFYRMKIDLRGTGSSPVQ